MSTKTEGQHTGEFIVSEAPGFRSHDQVTVTVPADTTLAPGTVLARLTADGKYVPYDNDGSDGSEAAYGILYDELVNEADAPADKVGVVLNTDCEVRRADLRWDATVDDNDKAAAYVDLLARGIKTRV
jgi:hypothetical protein